MNYVTFNLWVMFSLVNVGLKFTTHRALRHSLRKQVVSWIPLDSLSVDVWVNTSHLANNIKESTLGLVLNQPIWDHIQERRILREWYYQLQSLLLELTGIQAMNMNQLWTHTYTQTQILKEKAVMALNNSRLLELSGMNYKEFYSHLQR